MPVHEKEVDTRAIAILALASGVTLLATRAGLPADAAQGVAFFFGQGVPLVPRGMPQLVKQPVLGGNQPGQQRRIQADTLAGFGKQLLGGDKAIVLLGQRQRPVQAQDTPAEVPLPALPKSAQTSSSTTLNS